jgi:hypothetical protein
VVLGAVAGGACELEEFAADDVGIGSCGGEGLSATALRASRASIRSRSRWRSRSPSSMRCESVATISSSAVRRLFRPNSIPGSGRTKTSRPRNEGAAQKTMKKLVCLCRYKSAGVNSRNLCVCALRVIWKRMTPVAGRGPSPPLGVPWPQAVYSMPC